MFQRILLILILTLSAALPAAEVAATLLTASGQGQLLLRDGSSAEFKSGALVQPGSRIITAESGSALLLMDDGSRVSVGPNTDLTLTESLADQGVRSTVFELLRGLFHATVQKLTVGSVFQVKTADAVAAVKGTHFSVMADDQGTEAQVSEGTVWLENSRGERAVLKARMAARAERHGHLSEPRRMTRDELKRFDRWAKAALPAHSGALLPADQAKRAAWERLRPEQRGKLAEDLRQSLGDTWGDIVGLRAEERQERWRDRLRDADGRRLATEGARVDFALGKTALDRQGRRVRFDEFLLRPAADQVQFLNYTRRDDRVDLISSINTYNRALPHNLADAPGMNQRVWLQGLGKPPQFWVVDSAMVAGNSAGDSFAASNAFYDPFFRGLYWELPVKDAEIRLNIPDLQRPRVGGELVERWVRQVNGSASPIGATNGLTAMTGEAYNANLTVQLRSVPGSTNNLPKQANDVLGVVQTNLGNTNLVWALGDTTTLPTTTLLGPDGLEAKPGDLAVGFSRRYSSGRTLEFRNYVINENGEIVNIAGIPPDKLMEEFVNRGLIASLKQIEIRSNGFQQEDGINVVSKLLFLHDLFKNQDEL